VEEAINKTDKLNIGRPSCGLCWMSVKPWLSQEVPKVV